MTLRQSHNRKPLRAVLFIIMLLIGVSFVPGMSSAQPAMTQADLQALAYQVSANLHQAGAAMGVPPHVRAVYVPALTQEYLQVFQGAMMQGAMPQQADLIASQHIRNRVSQLMANAQGQQPRRKSLSERGMLFSTRDWVR